LRRRRIAHISNSGRNFDLKKNKELVEGKTVRLEKDITDRDKYSRLLRYVWVDSLLINLELVKQGFATRISGGGGRSQRG